MSSVNAGKEIINHLVSIQQNPNTKADTQTKMDAKRQARIEKALSTRPVFIPFNILMNAAGQNSPYNAKSNPLTTNDIIVIGAICDNPNRTVALKRAENSQNAFFISDNLNTQLAIKDFSGATVQSGNGQQSVFYFASPFIIPAGRRMSLDVYKPDDTADVEYLNLVLIGLTVNRRKFLLDDVELALIKQEMAFRPAPEFRFLKQTVNFDTNIAGGIAKNLASPISEEPLIIRGVKTTLLNSTIEVKLSGDTDWTLAPIPVWGIASEEGNTTENYRLFERPIYLPARTQIIMTVENGLNGSLDAQTGNSITWLCETV